MKKNFKTIIIAILSTIFLIPSVHADIIPPIIKDQFREWFGSGVPDDYVLRMLLTLLVFLIFYWGAGALFKSGGAFGDSKTNMFRWTIALVVALIVGLFTPMSIIQTYKTIFLLIVPIIIVFGGLALGHRAARHKTSEGHLAAAIIYLFIFVVMSLTLAKANEFGITDYRLAAGFSFVDLLNIVMFVFFILMVVHFFKAFKPGGFSWGRGPSTSMRRMRDNIETGERRDNRHDKVEKREHKDEKKEERTEKKEIKVETKIFIELKKLRVLVEEWHASVDTFKRGLYGDEKKKKEIYKELGRLKDYQGLRDRLEKYSIKNIKEIEHLDQLKHVTKHHEFNEIEKLAQEEANLNNVFEKMLNFISFQMNQAENSTSKELVKGHAMAIIAAINKAMQIEVKEIQMEKRELKDDKELEKET